MAEDLYSVLGVSRDASKDELRKAFKRKGMKYHPDRNKSPEAEERFKEIQKAYAVLNDDETRARYDQYGEAGLNGVDTGGFDPRDGDFRTIFDDLFGGGGPFGGGFEVPVTTQQHNRGADIQVSYTLDFEDAIRGRKIKMRINAPDKCEDCNGSGMAKGSRRTECDDCGGSGVMRRQVAMFSMQETCRRCHGTGEIIKDPCRTCGGSGATKQKKTVEVQIPAGIEHGNTMRLRGKGAMGHRPGSERGDLLLTVAVRPHDIFTRHGDNLECEMPVALTTAILGGEVKVPTLDGYIEQDLSKGTEHGRILRLRGKGARNVHTGRVGDLLCAITIEMPQRLNSEQTKLVRQLERSLKGNPNKHAPKVSRWADKVRGLFSKKGASRAN